jgi:hypothetical protein
MRVGAEEDGRVFLRLFRKLGLGDDSFRPACWLFVARRLGLPLTPEQFRDCADHI